MPKKGMYCSVPTKDGIQLKMRRYTPAGGDVAKNPVILFHGVLANKHSLDFGDPENDRTLWERYSLAAYLSRGGDDGMAFDVWVPELRGRRSFHSFSCEYPDMPEPPVWCVDDYIEKDVPAIIQKVQETYARERKEKDSNSPVKVFWVGMSMGGMLAYAYGENKRGSRNLMGVVTIGSPISFKHTGSFLIELASRILAPRRISVTINLGKFLNNHKKIKNEFMENIVSKSTIDKDVMEEYITLGFDNDISSKVLSQFAVFFRHNNFCRYPRRPWAYDILDRIPLVKRRIGPHSYTEELHAFETPLLALAGGKDREAPPQEVKYAVGHAGSRDITYREFPDYGHLDFHLGTRAREEVYSLIHRWLSKRTTIVSPE